MYVLKPNRKGRGFRLYYKRDLVFQTTKSHDVTHPSSVKIDAEEIAIQHNDQTSEIFKNGQKIGIVTYKTDTDFIITLYRLDGAKDFF